MSVVGWSNAQVGGLVRVVGGLLSNPCLRAWASWPASHQQTSRPRKRRWIGQPRVAATVGEARDARVRVRLSRHAQPGRAHARSCDELTALRWEPDPASRNPPKDWAGRPSAGLVIRFQRGCASTSCNVMASAAATAVARAPRPAWSCTLTTSSRSRLAERHRPTTGSPRAKSATWARRPVSSSPPDPNTGKAGPSESKSRRLSRGLLFTGDRRGPQGDRDPASATPRTSVTGRLDSLAYESSPVGDMRRTGIRVSVREALDHLRGGDVGAV